MEEQKFIHPMFGEIRVLTMEDGQVGFVGKDVAEVLGYKLPRKAILDHVDKDDVLKWNVIDAKGRRQQTTFINESGLYALILSSKLPQAREFKHWVTCEVLPQIRQTGGYIPIEAADDEQTILARALLIMQRTLEEKDKLIAAHAEQIEQDRPKVIFAQAVTSCPDSILIRDLAKLITQNGIHIGQARLFYWLRLHGYLFQRETRPIQKWVERGLFDTNVTVFRSHGRTFERITTKVTGLGQRYFIDGFLSGRFKADNQSFSQETVI